MTPAVPAHPLPMGLPVALPTATPAHPHHSIAASQGLTPFIQAAAADIEQLHAVGNQLAIAAALGNAVDYCDAMVKYATPEGWSVSHTARVAQQEAQVQLDRLTSHYAAEASAAWLKLADRRERSVAVHFYCETSNAIGQSAVIHFHLRTATGRAQRQAHLDCARAAALSLHAFLIAAPTAPQPTDRARLSQAITAAQHALTKMLEPVP